MKDSFGLDVTTDSLDALAAIDTFVTEFIGFGQNAAIILKAGEADPSSVLAGAHAAALHMFLYTGDAPDQARPFLERARAHLAQANERERLYFGAVEAWIAGDLDRAIELHHRIARDWPADVASARIGQIHCFNLGDAEGMLALGEAGLRARPDDPDAMAGAAFGLEQCHRLVEAERIGRRATEIRRKTPWAHHAVAHVMETAGRLDEGMAWMEGLADSWEDCNSFMYTHNWWHAALFRLDRDDAAGALAIFDRHLWTRLRTYCQDQVNAVSMLARLELRGADVGQRWRDVATYLAGRTRENVSPFLDLHYIYGLARAGRDDAVDAMIEAIAARAASAKPFERAAWAEAALPLARAMVAHGRGRWAEAADRFTPAMAHLHLIGGSHAQRDLWTQLHLDALIRTDRRAEARAILERRLAARPRIVHLLRQMADLRETRA
jgi:hypothetical protein